MPKTLILSSPCAVCGCHRVHWSHPAFYHLYLQCDNCGFEVGVYDDDPSATEVDFIKAWDIEANLQEKIADLTQKITKGENTEEDRKLLEYYSGEQKRVTEEKEKRLPGM